MAIVSSCIAAVVFLSSPDSRASFSIEENVCSFATRKPFPSVAFDGSCKVVSPSLFEFTRESIREAGVRVPPVRFALSRREGKLAMAAARFLRSSIRLLKRSSLSDFISVRAERRAFTSCLCFSVNMTMPVLNES